VHSGYFHPPLSDVSGGGGSLYPRPEGGNPRHAFEDGGKIQGIMGYANGGDESGSPK